MLVGSLVALAAPADGQRFLVRNYTEHDGLPNSKIEALAPGPDGRLWVLTRTGLAVFDGSSWRADITRNGPSLAGFDRLSVDAGGTVWALRIAPGPTLALHDGDRWFLRRPPTDLAPEPIVATSLAVVDRDPGTSFAAVGTANAGLLRYAEGRWHRLDLADGLPSVHIRALAVRDGQLYLGTRRGLARLAGARAHPVSLGDGIPDDASILALATDGGAHDPLWILGEDWLGRLDDQGFVRLGTHPGVREPSSAVMVEDRDGNLCFGDRSQLMCHRADDGTIESLGRDNGIRGEGVHALLRDWEGNLWVGNALGLSKLVDRRFATWNADHGLLEDEVTAVLRCQDSTLVLGHNEGLTLRRGGTQRTLRLERPGVDRRTTRRVLDLAEDATGRVWAATSGQGLALVEHDGTVTWPLPRDVDAASVATDDDGRVYAGTHQGIVRVDADGITPLGPPAVVRRVVVDGPRLYGATPHQGLLIVDGERHRFVRGTTPGLDNAFAVLPRWRDRTWVGTESGLAVMIDDRLVAPDEPRLLIRRPVYFLIADRQDRMWIGTDYGVYRWDGQQLRHFTVRDGLAGHETNRAAAWLETDGSLLIGTDQGVSRYRERSASTIEAPVPKVALLGLLAGQQELDPYTSTRLKPRVNSLTFRVRALTFRDENRVRYRTRLHGFDETWTESSGGTDLALRYRSLPPGRFRLLVQAARHDGPWSPVVASGSVRIDAPVHQRSWFLALVMAALSALVALVVSYLNKGRYARQLEAEVDARTAELAHAHREAVAEEQRLAATLGSIIEGVIAVDEAGRIAVINAAGCQLLGRDERSCLGQPLDTCLRLRSAHDGALIRPDEVVRETGEPITFLPVHILTEDRDAVREVELSGAPVCDPHGKRIGAVLALRDVGGQRQIEAELAKTQRLESLALLAAGIAHDFNNLLTILLGNLSLARIDPDPSRLDAYLGEAESAVDRAQKLAHQLLTFAAGGVPVTQPSSLADLVRQAAKFVFRGSSIRVRLDLPEDLLAVEIDAQQIDQVLTNLLVNARQAIRDGGTVEIMARNQRVRPGTHHALSPGAYVRLAIVDDGIGIDGADLHKIFDPYWTTKAEGSGLGLASSFSIVRRHRGTITCDSRPGRGATFEVFLPASTEPVAEDAGYGNDLPIGSGRVLVMDDEPSIRSVVIQTLTPLGFDVVAVADGRKAISEVREALDADQPFDLAILDLTIPGGPGGVATRRALSAMQPGLRLVASSGYADDPVMADCVGYGFDAALPKPYHVRQLAQVVTFTLAQPRNEPPTPGSGFNPSVPPTMPDAPARREDGVDRAESSTTAH